jgi:hypothetical protein
MKGKDMKKWHKKTLARKNVSPGSFYFITFAAWIPG